MQTILLISPYWKEPHRWMVSSVKLAELWQRLGYRVVVVCMGSENSVEEVSGSLVIHRRKDFFIPDPWNFGIAFGFSRYVRRVVKAEKPGHIVVNKILFWSSLSILGLRVRGYRVILLTDALVGMTWWPRGLLPRIAARIAAWTVGVAIIRSAAAFVTFHPQPPSLLRLLGVARRHRIIPTGIDPRAWPVRTDERAGAGITVTYTGRLESVKGVEDFLAVVTELRRRYPQMRPQVAGWYKEEHPLVARYERDVAFLGLQDAGQLRTTLHDTDIFVLPSYSEGLSNSLMEAMSSGCACVATDVGGNSFLLQNGVSGLLYPPGDRAALRAHLSRLIEDSAKREMVRRAARSRIEEVFSWDVVGKQYDGLFREFHS